MWKTVILTLVLTLAAAAPAAARTDHPRHSKTPAIGRAAPVYQPPRDRNDVPWAPF